jgi:hypothetical protein
VTEMIPVRNWFDDLKRRIDGSGRSIDLSAHAASASSLFRLPWPRWSGRRFGMPLWRATRSYTLYLLGQRDASVNRKGGSMTAETEKTCSTCQGSGKCPKCDGLGHVFHDLPTPIPVVSGKVRNEGGTGTRRTCPRCFGSGTCPTCKGSKKPS